MSSPEALELAKLLETSYFEVLVAMAYAAFADAPVDVPAENAHETEFIMLKDGGLAFEGTAGELRASQDAYLRAFLS